MNNARRADNDIKYKNVMNEYAKKNGENVLSNLEEKNSKLVISVLFHFPELEVSFVV